MAEKLQAVPVVLRQGQAQTEPAPFAAVFQGRGLHEDVTFCALLETPALDPAPLCQRALESYRRSIGSHRNLSLTSALRRALQDTHQELRAANEKLPLANQVGLGMTCLALRGEEVYIAQVEPGAVCLRDALGVRILHLAPASGEPPAKGREPGHGLGLATEEPPLLLHRQPLEQGQRLLAANSSLAVKVTYDGLVALLNAPLQHLPERLGQLMGAEPYFAALLVGHPRAS